jgi:hypothetical protein
MVTPNPSEAPMVSLADIEGLNWANRKKVKDDEPVIVTKFSFEAEMTGDQARRIHNLAKGGGPLTVVFRSPKLQMEMDLQGIQKEKADLGEGTEEP